MPKLCSLSWSRTTQKGGDSVLQHFTGRKYRVLLLAQNCISLHLSRALRGVWGAHNLKGHGCHEWQSTFVLTDSLLLRNSFVASRLGFKFWLWHLLTLGKSGLSGPVSSSTMGWGGVGMRGNIYLPPLADGKCGVQSLVSTKCLFNVQPSPPSSALLYTPHHKRSFPCT